MGKHRFLFYLFSKEENWAKEGVQDFIPPWSIPGQLHVFWMLTAELGFNGTMGIPTCSYRGAPRTLEVTWGAHMSFAPSALVTTKWEHMGDWCMMEFLKKSTLTEFIIDLSKLSFSLAKENLVGKFFCFYVSVVVFFHKAT